MATRFIVETSRKALIEMVIIDELSFKFVENDGLKDFVMSYNQTFKETLRGHRVCLTSRKALIQMVIIDALSVIFIVNDRFKRFCNILQPNF